MELNLDELSGWIGRTEALTDQVTVAPVQALSATLDTGGRVPQLGDPLPPCWHWLYFLPLRRQSELDVDGHPRRGAFLPPVPLPRRMWAGSRIEFLRPLRVGEAIAKTSRIVDVSSKAGRSGSLVFVRVRHEISGTGGVAIVEEQDVVYRERPQLSQAQKPPQPAAAGDEQFGRQITPDPVMLFRYSALTFNAHRIHYDRPYATSEEGYPGLVVQGPLIATLLLGEFARAHPSARVVSFEFKAINPLFDTAPFTVCGRMNNSSATLWARGPQGELAMQATATLSDH